MSTRLDSIGLFLEALDSVTADAPTACTDWTAHDVAAHLAAGVEEVNALIEDSLTGRPSRDTRGFAEREAPYLAMDDATLRTRLREHIANGAGVLADFHAAGADAVFEFNGAPFTAAQMQVHMEGELAIHRWDLVGDDQLGDELLSTPAFTRHAVFLLNTLPMLVEAPTNRVVGTDLGATTIVLRAAGQPDVALEVHADGAARFVHGDGEGGIAGQFVVTTDGANRLLTMWGRRSSRRPVSVTGDPALWGAVAAALWPDAREWPVT